MISIRKSLGFLLVLSAIESSFADSKTKTCSADDQECLKQQQCGLNAQEFCSSPSSFYQRGGTAQAYKANAPVSSQVCDVSGIDRYKAATWPYSRSNKYKAPRVNVNLSLYTCSMTGSQCCCTPHADANTQELEDDVTIEVWQAKPNGQYSSISPDSQDDDTCRATLEQHSFSTLAPGSTGVLGGLGPDGVDSMPYGPAVIHMLFSSPSHEPLLIHLPMVLDSNLQQQSFAGMDWRGPAHVTNKVHEVTFSIDKWLVNRNTIDAEVSIFLRPSENGSNLYSTLCPSTLYGTPSSFFLEPMALCAPSLLDFFTL